MIGTLRAIRCALFASFNTFILSYHKLKDEMPPNNGRRARVNSNSPRGISIERPFTTKNCHSNRSYTQWKPCLQLNSFHKQLIKRLFTILLLATLLSQINAHQNGRRVGDTLPYDPLDVRAQIEADLEEDLRREFVRGSLMSREDMTYRFPPKKTYSKCTI